MIEAVLFDMDGVITQTAQVHAAAWQRLFNEYLDKRAREGHERVRPFDPHRDYRELVDGRPRYEGVERFLDSRSIHLPRGTRADPPDVETVCGLGNRKNRYFREWLDRQAVQTFPGAIALVNVLRRAGVKTAVFSASRNAEAVLRSAGVPALFDAIVTGADAADLDIPGKPDPATLLEAAARLGVSPARAAVVEDATAGIEAAVRGGFDTIVGVDRAHDGDPLRRAGAHLVVRHLSEMTWAPNRGLVMKMLSTLPLFDERENDVRERLAGKVLTVFLDYDGTLTPIVEDYTKAFMSEDMRAAVAELARSCTVAIVSGRDVDVIRRLVGLESVYYAGSHGFEIRGPKGWTQSLEKAVEYLPQVDAAERELRESLAGIDGHAVERKRFSIAVHYRRSVAADVVKIQAIVDRVLTEHHGLRKGHGKKVFRIQPDIPWDKGHAVVWLLEQLNLHRPDVCPIYVGDDITDEDAFRALAGRGLSLVVRDPEDRPTAADYALADPDDVRRFLQFLAGVGERERH